MTATRWYLRPPGQGQTETQLVVEEVAPPHRGYCVSVATRAYAREMLPELTRILVATLARPLEPARTYDPEEDAPDEVAAGESLRAHCEAE